VQTSDWTETPPLLRPFTQCRMLRPPAPAAVPLPANPELPRHIGIIMDGNGRWARRRHLPRNLGHRAGVRAIRPVMEACDRLGVHILTVYAFSTENWGRPRAEVRALMRLFEETIDSEIDELHENGVQVRVVGRREELSERLQRRIERAEAMTACNTTAVLNVAINYGGRAEIVAAVRDLAARGADLTALDETQLAGCLYTAGLPDPDLIIRTAGEMRTSNFLLWQAAYAELYVTETLWPDFGERELRAAIAAFTERERKFGSVRHEEIDRATLASEDAVPVLPVLPPAVPAVRTG
jgi:undecaprenyl diphosphate synthase